MLVLAGWLWFARISVEPERVFWGAVERGLSTSSVTMRGEQSYDGMTSEQIVRYSLGAENLSHALTTLSQGGTTIKNEIIGTPDMDYIRYLSIQADPQQADGDADFSSVIGVWAEGQGGAQLFGQSLFGAGMPAGVIGMPIGQVSPDDRTQLLQQIKDDVVYQVDFDKVKKEREDGRLLYVYDVNVQPVAYIALMKSFFQKLGLRDLDAADPSAYAGQQAFQLQIAIDARARQMVRVTSPDTGATQTYSDYGVPVQLQIPDDAISFSELQKRISDL